MHPVIIQAVATERSEQMRAHAAVARQARDSRASRPARRPPWFASPGPGPRRGRCAIRKPPEARLARHNRGLLARYGLPVQRGRQAGIGARGGK